MHTLMGIMKGKLAENKDDNPPVEFQSFTLFVNDFYISIQRAR